MQDGRLARLQPDVAAISNNGYTASYVGPNRCTVFSREVFDMGTATLSERCVFAGGAHGGDVAFGLIGEHPTLAACTHMAGEVEIPNSIAALVRTDRVCILKLDKLRDADVSEALVAQIQSGQDIPICINLSHGKLSVMIFEHNFHMPSFDGVTLQGMGRLAISLTGAGQRAYLAYDGVTVDASPERALSGAWMQATSSGNMMMMSPSSEFPIVGVNNKSSGGDGSETLTSRPSTAAADNRNRAASAGAARPAAAAPAAATAGGGAGGASPLTAAQQQQLLSAIPGRVLAALTASYDAEHVALPGPLRIAPSYAPPESLAADLKTRDALRELLPQLDFMVDSALAIAKDRVGRQAAAVGAQQLIDLNEGFAIALFTFELGMMAGTEDGSDEFAAVLNHQLRVRLPAVMLALRGFLFYFTRAWATLPRATGEAFRAVPARSVAHLAAQYQPIGRSVHWSSFASVTVDRRVAEAIARRGGGGGAVLSIVVTDARSIGAFAAVPVGPAAELVLFPGASCVVTSPLVPPTAAGGVASMSLLQIIEPNA